MLMTGDVDAVLEYSVILFRNVLTDSRAPASNPCSI
jgi:hypothetical protein